MRKLVFQKSQAVVQEFQLFSNSNDIIEYIKGCVDKGQLVIGLDITNDTKTRLSLSIEFGKATFGLNLENTNYKQDLVSSYSYFSSSEKHSYYFKTSKKQGLDVFKNYVSEQVNGVLDTLKERCEKLNIDTSIFDKDIIVITDYLRSNVDREEFSKHFDIKELV